MWERLFIGPVDLRAAALALVPTLLVAWLIARIVRKAAVAGLRALLQESLSLSSPLVRRPLRLISAAAFLISFAILLFPALQVAGLQVPPLVAHQLVERGERELVPQDRGEAQHRAVTRGEPVDLAGDDRP